MHGEQTRRAIAAQPEWLAQVPTDRRFPAGARLLFTGCGTSFHAALTGGEAVQALELVLRPERDADFSCSSRTRGRRRSRSRPRAPGAARAGS